MYKFIIIFLNKNKFKHIFFTLFFIFFFKFFSLYFLFVFYVNFFLGGGGKKKKINLIYFILNQTKNKIKTLDKYIHIKLRLFSITFYYFLYFFFYFFSIEIW